MRRLRIGFEDGRYWEIPLLNVPDTKLPISADERDRNILPGLAGAELHFDDAAERLVGRTLVPVALPPRMDLQNVQQIAVVDAGPDRERRHERLTAERERPDWPVEGSREAIKERPVAVQTDEEVGVGQVET